MGILEDSQEIKGQIDHDLTQIEHLSAITAVAQRAISMANNPDVNIRDLAEEISRDTSITASIIKLANSSYFSPGKQIRSIQEAIVILGLNSVKDIIVIAASKGILKTPLDGYRLEDTALWEHSILVAELSSRISKMKKCKTKPDVAFTAGLLHDIGKIVLAQYFRKIYRSLINEMEKNPDARFTDLERKYLGYSHNELGSKLLTQWNFPPELVEAILFFYHPQEAKTNQELTSIVHVANVLALASGVGIDVGGMNESLVTFALDKLKLTNDDIAKLYSDIPEMLEEIADMRYL